MAISAVTLAELSAGPHEVRPDTEQDAYFEAAERARRLDVLQRAEHEFDPIPFDAEYTRDLGYCATKYLFSGGNAAMISIQGGHFVPIPFAQLLDPQTGKAKIRMVDVHSTRYGIARRSRIM